jgi:hypothetical protein
MTMANDKNDSAKQARADRRQAERDARIRTGRPAASVTPRAKNATFTDRDGYKDRVTVRPGRRNAKNN